MGSIPKVLAPIAFVVLSGFASDEGVSAPPHAVAEARRAVERALPHLERGGVSWMNERGCVSCHRTTYMIWAHQDARVRGIEVDDTKLESWTNEAFVSMLAQRDEGGGADSMAQMLLGRDRGSSWRAKPPRHFKTSDPYERLYEMLLDRQSEDGSWPAEGQLATPPSLTTRWVWLALASRSEVDGDPGAKLDPDAHMSQPLTGQVKSNDERIPKSLERGLEYLRDAEPHASHEDRVLRALVDERASGPRPASERAAILLAAQNADGGWSNRLDRTESDAYATGMTLYALARLGVSREDPAARRGREYLIRSQRSDGSWSVPADHVREGKRNESLDEIYSYWGSAWATIGLLMGLPGVVESDD